MKKLIAVIAALFMVVGIASVSMAAQQVEVKTNSEGITGAENACEKAGNITFIFDSGTVLRDGDWWTADLPLGVTLCSSFDFVVTGNGTATNAVPGPGGFNGTISVAADGASIDNTIWGINDHGSDGAAGNVVVAGTEMFFRVRGTAGSNRMRIDVYDSDNTTVGNGGVGAAANYDGTSTFTVSADASFQLKLFDGFDGNAAAGRYAFNDTPTGTPAAINGFYGDAPAGADFLQVNNDTDNSYCIQADTEVYSGSTVNVSINSGGVSGNNFLTFNPANPQVAHLISATSITLEACKGELQDYVPFTGGQNANCMFDYMDGSNYCQTDGWAGNDLILTNNTGNWGNSGDQYRVRMIVSGNGAYWGGQPTFINGTLPGTEDPCDGDGTNVSTGWTVATESGVAASVTPRGAACGEFDADEEWTVLTSNAFSNVDTYNKIWLDTPQVYYDADQFVAGDEVTVTVELWKLPCGLIFTDSRVIATFVDTCAAAVPNTTLYYPYTVALDGSQGWWFGMTIGNPSANAGTATVTFYEADGDMGTYTTPEIAAGGIVVLGGADLLTNLTADPGNAGTLGDAAGHIVVITNFGSAGGFAMTGDGSDSTGYTAYGVAGGAVAAWNY
ncbi:MAG: hypothetical protein CSA23_02870 [Deltaproteobacteria bacterium]|nr:MAG: hypothetical protein CSA23_02870 [Deltaproteobacteria bacterium]